MPALPVRVEIRSEFDGGFIRFVLPAVQFCVEPRAGDYLEFFYDGWAARELGQVRYLLHGIGAQPLVQVVCQIESADRDVMLAIFDKFKDSQTLQELETESERPPPYYLAYRLIYGLWGKKVFEPATDLPAALGGLLHCALSCFGMAWTGPAVEQLHQLIIEHKCKHPGSPVPLMWLFHQLDKSQQFPVDLAALTIDRFRTSAIAYFEGLRSVPLDKFPARLYTSED